MKVKSNLIFNISVYANHAPEANDGKVVIGGSTPNSITIPAGATLELADAEWKQYEKAAKPLLDKGHLEMVQAVELTKTEQKAADAAELKELEAKAKALKEKADTKPKA